MAQRKAPLAARFRKFFIPGEPDECWLWTGGMDGKGRGAIKADGGKVQLIAPRVAYEMANGPIPPGLFVCHSCDNGACVNPRHLWLGTQLDNVGDRDAKGRTGRMHGSKNWKTRLTEADVLVIRRQRADGRSAISLAGQYGIAYRSISKIIDRTRWKHI